MEGKEIIGVVRKVVFKDKNGGYDLDSCIKDGVKCYLYIDYIDESIEDPKKQLQMIVLEDIYYSVSSVIKLKFVDGKWHFLTELNRYDIVQDGLLYDFCMCDKWYPYASKEKENDRKEKSKLNDKVILKELFEFFEQLRITDEENSIIREKDPTGFLEAIENMDSLVLDELGILKSDRDEMIEMFNKGIDFNKKEFIEILEHNLFGNSYNLNAKELYYILVKIQSYISEKKLYKVHLISLAGLLLNLLNYMDLLTDTMAKYDVSKSIEQLEDDEYYSKSYLFILKDLLNYIIDAKAVDMPINSQIREELKQKQLLFQQKLERYER